MDTQGLIDLPLRVNGQEVKIGPVSPLAQAQKLQEVNDAMQYAQIAMSMGVQGAATVSVQRLLEFVADRMGIDSKILATGEEQMQFLQAMQQQAAQAQMAEQGAPAEGAMQ
jgi:inorganic pyrophosphatase/exopolyphosphatase